MNKGIHLDREWSRILRDIAQLQEGPLQQKRQPKQISMLQWAQKTEGFR